MKGLTPYDPHRYGPSVRMLGYILVQDKRDGVFRVVNQDIPKIAIKLDGSAIRDAFDNQEDIPKRKEALFFDQEFVRKIVKLQKEKEEEQAWAMVVVPHTEFVITAPNPNRLTIEAVTPKRRKDATTGQIVTPFETSTQLTEAQKKRLKNIVKPAVDALDRPFIPYVPLDLLPKWFYDATPKTGDSGKSGESERGKLTWGR